MKLSIFVPLTVFLSFTTAELTGSNDDVGSTDDISSCLNKCLTEGAVVAGCASQYDTECTCPSLAFKDALSTCLEAACTQADLDEAGKLHEERCGTTPE